MVHLLEKDGCVNINHFWSAQTYYAIVAASIDGSKALPDSYKVNLCDVNESTIARHYVGIPRVRPQFFLEGIVKPMKDLN